MKMRELTMTVSSPKNEPRSRRLKRHKVRETQGVLTDFHALERGEALAVTSTGDIGGGGVENTHQVQHSGGS